MVSRCQNAGFTSSNKANDTRLEGSVWPLLSSYCFGSIIQGNASCNYFFVPLPTVSASLYTNTDGNNQSSGTEGNTNSLRWTSCTRVPALRNELTECKMSTEHAQFTLQAKVSVCLFTQQSCYRFHAQCYMAPRCLLMCTGVYASASK